MEDDLSQKLHGNMILSVYMYKCYKYNIILLPQKASSPEKVHLKVTFPLSLKNMIFIPENMVFLLKHYID